MRNKSKLIISEEEKLAATIEQAMSESCADKCMSLDESDMICSCCAMPELNSPVMFPEATADADMEMDECCLMATEDTNDIVNDEDDSIDSKTLEVIEVSMQALNLFDDSDKK